MTMATPPYLDHVQIAAPRACEPQARRFYGGVIGLCELEKPEPLRIRGGAWFAVGDAQLHIGVEEPFAPARKAHPAFRCNDAELQTLAERLPPRERRFGGTRSLRACADSSLMIRGATGWSSSL
jgi:hypothetical protein